MGRYNKVSLSGNRGFNRESYVLGARAKLISLGMARGSKNDGSLLRTAMQRGAGLRFSTADLRGPPPFLPSRSQRGYGGKDWRDSLSEEQKMWYRSNGMADKKGKVWKDAYTIGAKIRARKKGFNV